MTSAIGHHQSVAASRKAATSLRSTDLSTIRLGQLPRASMKAVRPPSRFLSCCMCAVSCSPFLARPSWARTVGRPTTSNRRSHALARPRARKVRAATEKANASTQPRATASPCRRTAGIAGLRFERVTERVAEVEQARARPTRLAFVLFDDPRLARDGGGDRLRPAHAGSPARTFAPCRLEPSRTARHPRSAHI